MSRDTELAKDYAYMSNLVERFERRKTLRVEGKWYLFEKEKNLPFIASTDQLADSGYTLEMMRKIGWLATPVNVFREDGS